jgi:quercetin dioxygenase-like cupin family protein
MHLRHGDGATHDLGIAKMRLLSGTEEAGGTYALAEFTGGAGEWTVPHVHRMCSEAFFVLDGAFTFTIGDQTIEAARGDYLLVPPETRHVLGAGAAGGTILVWWAPGGLEKMFIELAQLPPGALLDPKARAEVSSRHDSVPV